MISYDTPLEAIEQIRLRLQAYVAQNNREWSNVGVNIDKMDFQNAITLIIAMERMYTTLLVLYCANINLNLNLLCADRPNWQDWGGRWARRTLFMRNLKAILEDLDITYSMPVQPVSLPKYSPYPNGSSMGLQAPGGRQNFAPSSSQDFVLENLGNAGQFRGGGYGTPPGPTIRVGGTP